MKAVPFFLFPFFFFLKVRFSVACRVGNKGLWRFFFGRGGFLLKNRIKEILFLISVKYLSYSRRKKNISIRVSVKFNYNPTALKSCR